MDTIVNITILNYFDFYYSHLEEIELYINTCYFICIS